MNLYNMMNDRHPLAAWLLNILGYHEVNDISEIPRFRDIFLFKNEIRILTRTGGGNREDYEDEIQMLRVRPGFLRDWDDTFDSTYAWWAYEWPQDHPMVSVSELQIAFDAIKEISPTLLPESLESITNAAIKRMQDHG